MLEIACQNCGQKFIAVLSDEGEELERAAREKSIRYGDPPDADCCNAGPTMSSLPLRILEFWQMKEGWQRERDLEGALYPLEPAHDREKARQLLQELGDLAKVASGDSEEVSEALSEGRSSSDQKEDNCG